VRLAERIGRSRAAQLFYTAALVDAETMLRWGLVNEVVAKDRLMQRANEIAREMCRCSPETLRAMKRLTGQAARDPARQARLRAEIDQFALHVGGSDLAEGLEAFRTKRLPAYRDPQ
jgi:enoyl-CoA hydratase/carnithine racemase